jgi:hypothetical protein
LPQRHSFPRNSPSAIAKPIVGNAATFDYQPITTGNLPLFHFAHGPNHFWWFYKRPRLGRLLKAVAAATSTCRQHGQSIASAAPWSICSAVSPMLSVRLEGRNIAPGQGEFPKCEACLA